MYPKELWYHYVPLLQWPKLGLIHVDPTLARIPLISLFKKASHDQPSIISGSYPPFILQIFMVKFP
jgi:hypothetical protein